MPSVLSAIVAPFSAFRRWRAARQDFREFQRQQREKDHGDFRIAALERANDELRHNLRLAREDLKQQIEINARDRERVAWETARFSADREKLLAIAKMLGAGNGGSNAAAQNAVNELMRGL